MEERRFDAAMRALDGAITRRRGLAAALGVLLGGAIGETEAKRRRKSDKGNGRHGTKKPGWEGPCGGGTRTDNACTEDSFCCTGFCDTTLDSLDGLGRCRCIKKGRPCTRKQTCCGRLSCINKVCASSGGGAGCSAANCASGCCAGDVCVATASQGAATCGTGGAACAACASGTTCTAGVCVCTPALQSIAGTGDSEISNPKGSFLSADKLTLYIASWNPADISSGGRVSIWSRATTNEVFAFDQKLESANLLKPGFVTASADGTTVATMSVWNDCGVVFKKTAGVWAESGTLGTCGSGGSGNTQLSDPTSLALNTDGTTAYIGDSTNARISVWKLTGSTWGYDSSILTGGGGGQCGSGSDPNAQTCPKGVFVNAAEDKIYICSGTFDHGLQVVTKSGSTWTGAWAGPNATAPNAGGGCWVDTVTENVLVPDGTTIKLSNFTTGTSWDAVTLALPPTSDAVNVSVRGFTTAAPNDATWSFAEGFGGAQVTSCAV